MAITINYTRNRPNLCAFFAGRAWYAGVNSVDKSGWVLFSQVANDPSLLNRCYSKNDPTSEVFSDLLDDDGGLIPIPDAGKIVALKPLGNAVVVLATKGVWSIRGGDGGFKATDYAVDKVTDAGCVSAKSVVQGEGMVFYWSTQGVYALAVDQTGIANSKNISDLKIKAYYNALSVTSKMRCAGTYNASTKIITWAFASDVSLFDTKGAFYKDTLLQFDVQLEAFYTENIAHSTHTVVTPATTKESLLESETSQVVVGNDNVITPAGDVVASIVYTTAYVKRTKFLTLYPDGSNYSVTFSEYDESRNGFADWGTEEKSAYVVTGYNMGGVGPARQKTAPMVTVFAKRTEEEIDDSFETTKQSSIKMQTRWDFTSTSFTNKWSPERETYRQSRPFFLDVPQPFEDGYPLVITKNKVLGRGKALQIKWQAGDDKDCKLVGWSINFVGNNNV